MKDAELRVIATRADREVLAAMSTAGIAGTSRTEVKLDGDKLIVVTTATMTAGQGATYTELSQALRRAAGGQEASITQDGKLRAIVRWKTA